MVLSLELLKNDSSVLFSQMMTLETMYYIKHISYSVEVKSKKEVLQKLSTIKSNISKSVHNTLMVSKPMCCRKIGVNMLYAYGTY